MHVGMAGQHFDAVKGLEIIQRGLRRLCRGLRRGMQRESVGQDLQFNQQHHVLSLSTF